MRVGNSVNDKHQGLYSLRGQTSNLRSREVSKPCESGLNFSIAIKFDRQLECTAVEMSVKCQSGTVITTSNLTASRPHETYYSLVNRGPGLLAPMHIRKTIVKSIKKTIYAFHVTIHTRKIFKMIHGARWVLWWLSGGMRSGELFSSHSFMSLWINLKSLVTKPIQTNALIIPFVTNAQCF